MKRYILTGAPGAGKTTILHGLRERGWAVVEEAATDVIAREQAVGVSEPWRRGDFIDKIVAVQRERQQQPVPNGVGLGYRALVLTCRSVVPGSIMLRGDTRW